MGHDMRIVVLPHLGNLEVYRTDVKQLSVASERPSKVFLQLLRKYPVVEKAPPLLVRRVSLGYSRCNQLLQAYVRGTSL